MNFIPLQQNEQIGVKNIRKDPYNLCVKNCVIIDISILENYIIVEIELVIILLIILKKL